MPDCLTVSKKKLYIVFLQIVSTYIRIGEKCERNIEAKKKNLNYQLIFSLSEPRRNRVSE